MEFLTVAKLAAEIKSILKADGTIKSRVQVAATSIIHHAMDCGDCTAAATLACGLRTEADRNALTKWFATFSLINVDQKEHTAKLSKSDTREWDIDKAITTPWHTFKPASKTKAKSLDQLLSQLRGEADQTDADKVSVARRVAAARMVMLYEQDQANQLRVEALAAARKLIAEEAEVELAAAA